MLEAERKTGIPRTGVVVGHVSKLGKVKSILREISGGRKRFDLSGLHGSSPVLLVEALRIGLRRPLVLCCAEEEAAEDAYSDLQTISGARIELFPQKDIFPQRLEIRENLSVRGRRNACLDRIVTSDVDVVVTSFLGFLEKTVPRDALVENTREMRKGQTVDLETLRRHLTAVGYEAVPLVEEFGQFAVRGAIVDVFDPSWDAPVRLEFLDDEIASIREFDIDSQRSMQQLEAIRIRPAAGVVVDEHALRLLETRMGRAGVAAQTISEIAHELELHRYSHLLRRYAPAMGMDGALLDFFAAPPVLVFWGEEKHHRSLDGLKTEFDRAKQEETNEYPLLDLQDYVHPPDYYLSREVPSIHIWDLPPPAPPLPGAGGDAAGGALPRGVSPPGPVVQFSTAEHPSVLGKFDTIVEAIRKYRKRGVDIYVYSESAAQRERLADMLEENEQFVHLPVGWISSGFVWDEAGVALFTDHQIFRRILPRPPARRRARRRQGFRHDQLQIGDFVVHVDYGIGRYLGLEKLDASGRETECLSIRYFGNDRIYVPLEQMDLVEKYVGSEGAVPRIDRLGSSKWQRTKEKTRKALEDIARDLLQIYAEREIAVGRSFGRDTPWQKELEAAFPYEETPHQLQATEDIKRDMESSRPMDRLVCGDVGFGKTEVAIRAAFKAVNDGQQVAVLVPTTILALQHYETFRERMAAFPVRIEMLSRFRTPAEQKEIIGALNGGTVDIVIGTHRLLSKDVGFRDLGLLIVDEEHRFGVRSKEKLKRLKKSVDVLSLTATPIPRTLYMALSGLRPMSVIDTPPRNRHPIKTEVLPFDEEVIARAITAEIDRRGQVFFVHNRVATIHSIRAMLERRHPGIRFGVAHGQMGEKELEGVVLDFLRRKFDVLVSTMIIESGLDFPNVNTIVINRADRFGLAQLYQLRGRVGRREQQAYAYLLVPRNFLLTETAGKRLQAMEEFEELGSGYRLAMRDLEIRGAGNVLGVEQHGQMVAVGFDLYCKMLREAVDKLKGETREERPPCRVESGLNSFLPDRYVEDENERMAIYKRLARLGSVEELEALEDELVDRFGRPPAEAVNLLELTQIKLRGEEIGAALVQIKPARVAVQFLPGRSLPPQLCADLVETFEGRVLFKSDDTFGLTVSLGSGVSAVPEAKKLLQLAHTYVNKGSSPNDS